MEAYLEEAEKATPIRLTYLVPQPSCWKNYSSCPWAKTVICDDPISEDLICCHVTCKRWGCEYCARMKIRRLAYLTNGAKPNRMLTLTVDPSLYESPKDAWEKTVDKVPELIRWIRLSVQECEYLRVTELHKSGWPHYHLLLRSSYIPQQQLSKKWEELTGAIKVDIRKVDNTFSSFRYLVKYLTKLHRIEWTDRHVSYSRNYYNPADLEKVLYPDRPVLDKSDEHPWLWLSKRYYADQIGVDERGNYHLPYMFAGTPWQLSRANVGLPFLPETCEPATPQKKQQAMLETEAEYDYTTLSF